MNEKIITEKKKDPLKNLEDAFNKKDRTLIPIMEIALGSSVIFMDDIFKSNGVIYTILNAMADISGFVLYMHGYTQINDNICYYKDAIGDYLKHFKQ